LAARLVKVQQMRFVKTFKGHEDRAGDLDAVVNQWARQQGAEVWAVQPVLSHKPGAVALSGDVLQVVLYEAEAPLP